MLQFPCCFGSEATIVQMCLLCLSYDQDPPGDDCTIYNVYVESFNSAAGVTSAKEVDRRELPT